MQVRIHILYEFKSGPWGGGNQFLKALKREFKKEGIYASKPEQANVIIFNSHHNLLKVLNHGRKFSEKTFVHRLDGPVSLVRGTKSSTDQRIYKYNDLLADATIFQTQWSKKKNIELGYSNETRSKVIKNAPDNRIFNPNGKAKFHPQRVNN